MRGREQDSGETERERGRESVLETERSWREEVASVIKHTIRENMCKCESN